MSNDGSFAAISLFDASQKLSLLELEKASGLGTEEIETLVDFGVLEPLTAEPGTANFPAFCLLLARRAYRLRVDFDLNPPGVALALTYLQRIEDLEARLHELECGKVG